MTAGYELIIAEKPSAAKKIAEALADKKIITRKEKKVSYFEVTHQQKPIIICSAVGHLFGVKEKDKQGWTYPVFSYEWAPTAEVDKSAAHTKEYSQIIKKLAKEAEEFTIATDYDIEGSTIGYNCIKYLCKKNDAKRMKFSTVTKDELKQAYENASAHLDFPQIKAGLTRHELDWLWGINLSRALSLSIKNATGRFKILSTGRVQGPALHVLTQKEHEIEAFVKTPYWEIALEGTVNKEKIQAEHKEGQFQEKKRAEEIFNKTKEKEGIITDITATTKNQEPPHPFDLTSLQLEAYKTIGIAPKKTLELAQSLYSNGYMSYPRTSSQKLPKSIDYKKILKGLQKQFPTECQWLEEKKELVPNEGKKEDAAHPAIYPTGEIPKRLTDQEKNLYELIVRRFFATFGEAAQRETMTLTIEIEKEPFIAKGTHTIKKGWHSLYGRFVKLEEKELPQVKKGDKVTKTKMELEDKETQPPKRFTEASIIKELEKKNLGTKATRAAIIQNLYDRSYIEGKSIQVTTLGKKTIETLEKYSPEVIDEKLTRKFEKEMHAIEEEKQEPEKILAQAKKYLTITLEKFKENEKKIGEQLAVSHQETQERQSYLGQCPVCKEGKFQIRRGKFGFFAACARYPECTTTASLPKAKIEPLQGVCESCQYPMIKIIKAKTRPQETCLNINCPTKAVSEEIQKQQKNCPKCQAQLVIKKTLTGAFWACPSYPKCRHAESIEQKSQSAA